MFDMTPGNDDEVKVAESTTCNKLKVISKRSSNYSAISVKVNRMRIL